MGFISTAGIYYGSAAAAAAAGTAIGTAYRYVKSAQPWQRARRHHRSSQINYINATPANNTNTSIPQRTTPTPIKKVKVGIRMGGNGTRTNTTRIRLRRRPAAMQAAGAKIRTSSGLVIGKARKTSQMERVRNMLEPPQKFEARYTFQADFDSGRVGAVGIPILTNPLLQPIKDQLYTGLVTDTSVVDGTMAQGSTGKNLQYSFMIKSYVSRLQFYNSSTNTCQCRLVWYKPTRDMSTALYNDGGSTNVVPYPINILMMAANASNAYSSPNVPSVGSGLAFDALTAGSNYSADYNHAGQPYVGTTTTASSAVNNVAQFDMQLVPGSSNVKSVFNHFYTTVKTEDFKLEPGNQYNTSLTLRNKMNRLFVDEPLLIHKDVTVIGVLYVLGQMVTSNVSGNTTISTGSSQISVIRQDTCTAKITKKKAATLINLSNAFVVLADSAQAIVNNKTDDFDISYGQNN